METHQRPVHHHPPHGRGGSGGRGGRGGGRGGGGGRPRSPPPQMETYTVPGDGVITFRFPDVEEPFPKERIYFVIPKTEHGMLNRMERAQHDHISCLYYASTFSFSYLYLYLCILLLCFSFYYYYYYYYYFFFPSFSLFPSPSPSLF